MEIKISLNSLSKQPAFILIPPPIVPGIQDKNSKPPKLFSIAKSDSDLSVTALPAIMISLFSKDILLKLFDSLIFINSSKIFGAKYSRAFQFIFLLLLSIDIAIDLILFKAPSLAAATVPEYNIS